MLPETIADGIQNEGWMEEYKLRVKEKILKEVKELTNKELFDPNHFLGDDDVESIHNTDSVIDSNLGRVGKGVMNNGTETSGSGEGESSVEESSSGDQNEPSSESNVQNKESNEGEEEEDDYEGGNSSSRSEGEHESDINAHTDEDSDFDGGGKFERRREKVMNKPVIPHGVSSVEDMLTENLIYQETMTLLLKEKNSMFTYQGFDPSIRQNQYIRESQDGFDFSTADYLPEDDNETVISHLIAEKPFSSEHVFKAEIQQAAEEKVYQRIEKLYKSSAFENTILQHTHQLSMWKLNDQSVVKIKEQYFTPEHSNSGEFTMSMSVDKTALVLSEVSDFENTSIGVLLFDVNTLEKRVQLSINRVDESIQDEVDEYGNLNQYGEPTMEVSETLPMVTAWAEGQYILVQTFAKKNDNVCY